MLKAHFLSIWYDLSDIKLAEALDDRGSAASGATPERAALASSHS